MLISGMIEDMNLQAVTDKLLASTGASRCTLRQDVLGADFFPVTHESLASGVESLMNVRSVDQKTTPVVLQIQREGRQVVQNDCATAFPGHEAFHEMRRIYGGLAAQIVTPVFAGEKLVAIISLHQLGQPRAWTKGEIRLASEASERARELIEAKTGI